jgi:Sortase domain
VSNRRRVGRHRRRPSTAARILTALTLAVLAAASGVVGVRLLDGIRVGRSPDTGNVPVAASTTGPQAGPEPGRRPSLPAATPRPPARTPPPGVPVKLALPSERVSALVVPAGTRPDGELRLPRSPSVVGWWVRSAPAGDRRDTTLLAGHVDSAAEGLGALAALREIDVGSRVVLTDTFGVEHSYRVAARRVYPKYALPDDIFTVAGRARVVLITCGGPFDEDAGRYRDNVVVYALPS